MPSKYELAVDRYWGLPVPSHLKHGTNTWAAKVYGCDCKLCLPSGKRRSRNGEGKSARQRQRESRARLLGQPVPPDVKHGVYAYHMYGCRCPTCRGARSDQQYRRKNRWRETSRGEWTERDGKDIIHWPPRDAEYPWVCPTCDHKIMEARQ